MDFENKVVIITGGSSGIGASIAVEFAKLSAKVVIVGRNAENLTVVAKQCEEAKNIKPLVVEADVTVDVDVERIVNETVKDFGRIDVLVNNAGAGAVVASILDGIQIFDKMIATNLRSVYLLTSLAVPHLIKTKGNIINISSIAATKVIPNYLPYAVSEAGLDMFTRSLAAELGEHGVRVNAVSTGPGKSKFHDRADMNSDVVLAAKAKQTPLRKHASSGDIAQTVIFLASDKARNTTATINVVDMGEILWVHKMTIIKKKHV
ncbi:hypothetical protein MSG28_013366 [Choristoneura fumiferana]|uniref:Uncharacterized protein n=1 Tax=Choristoneura fumiferana TaxID=7141 RepID=A0ACC0KTM4_CHOFU|nr:hypothetical protein MSG28_013366 [Choristoneura fumiferana]